MKTLATLLLSLAFSSAANSAAAQQSCEPSWLPTFGPLPGINDAKAFAVFDDGSGSGPALYVGGSFTTVGGVSASGIAKWDGSKWSALGSGLSGGSPTQALALTVFDDGSGPALYVGGEFTNAGGLPGTGRMAKWDGSSWSALGSGMSGGPGPWHSAVRSFAVFDDGSGGGPALYAGGGFTNAGGSPATISIARWNGTSWSTLAGGMNLSGNGAGAVVLALTVFDDGSGSGPALYAGGGFVSAGGVPVNRIAKWDGTSWSSIGNGVSGAVRALTVFDDGSGSGPALYAGGAFFLAGGIAAPLIAKWDGSIWSALGSGLSGGLFQEVFALSVFHDGSGGGPALYAGGGFTSASGVPGTRLVAKWDGSGWSALGGGMTGASTRSIDALTVYDDGGEAALYAGGSFTSASGVPGTNNIAKWSGTSWTSLGKEGGPNGRVDALTILDSGSGGVALYAGGDFTTAGGIPTNDVARWDGSQWSALGGGVSGGGSNVLALTVFDDGGGGGLDLYAGGGFMSAGGVAVSRIAMWDGSSWSGVGGGTNSRVRCFAIFDDGSGPSLYAGGDFTFAGGVSANYIAKWDGSAWSSLGTGVNNGVRALAVFDDASGAGPALYVGGFFTSAGGAPDISNIARWDGSTWTPLLAGTDAIVLALTVFDDQSGGGPALYTGGGFSSAGGLPTNNVAKWDGSSWMPLGSGTNGPVRSLQVFEEGSAGGPGLFVAGNFTSAGGGSADSIAKWDGASWSSLGIEMNASVNALTVFDDGSGSGPALFAGGEFTVSSSRDSYLAKWGCPPSPFIMFCTAKTTNVCGPANISANGTPSATATSGFTIKAQPVRGCRAGLLLYSNQPTVTGAPFGGPGDGVLCLFGMGLKRAGPIMTGSLPNLCEATFAIDMNKFNTNNWVAGGCNPPPGQNNPAGFLGNMGTTVNAQMWGRDSIATGQVLSDGISWAVGP